MIDYESFFFLANFGQFCYAKPMQSSNFRTILGALFVCNMLVPVLMSGFTPVLPLIGEDLAASAVQLSFVMVVYAYAQVIFNLLGGRFGDIWGRKRILMVGVGMFGVCSFAIGFVQDMAMLLFLRFCQGTAGALISSCSSAIAYSLAPAEVRGRVMGLMNSSIYLGLSIGPLVGGAIASFLNWRWLFWIIIVPSGIVFFLLSHNIHQEWRESKGEKLDVAGGLLVAVSFGVIALGAGLLEYAEGLVCYTLMAVGAGLFVVFLWQEHRTKFPLMELGMFRTVKGFAVGLVAMLINYGSTMGIVFFLSLYLLTVRGLDPFAAGLFIMVQSLVQVFFSPLGGRLADKYGPDQIAALGTTFCALGIFGMSFLNTSTPLLFMTLCQISVGLGIGFFSAPNTISTLRFVDSKHLAVATGLLGSMRTLGMLLSQVMISVILGFFMGRDTLGAQNTGPFLQSMHTGFLLFASLNILGICLGLGRLQYAKKHG